MPAPWIFCGKAADSAEYLWSRALGPEIGKRLPSGPSKYYKAIDGGGRYEMNAHGMPLYNTTIPCVCQRCNNGWMNRLDERTREKTIRLIRNQQARYDQSDTLNLASWLSMKMMVRDQYKKTISVFSEADHANFYLTGKPAERMWIGLCRNESFLWAGAFHRQARIIGENGITSWEASYTMGLGVAVAFVEYSTGRVPRPQIASNRVMQLWPKPLGFPWPAHPPLNAAQVRAIAMRFNPAADSARDLFSRAQLDLASPPRNRAERRARNRDGT
jgi:hypothetical protein